MRFRTTVERGGKTATGLLIPDHIVATLDSGKRPSVRVAVGGHSYRTTVASMGGRFLVPLSAENRAAAGIAAGDKVDVEITLDSAPREVTVPADLADKLARDDRARNSLTNSPTATARSGCAGSRRPREPKRAAHAWTKQSCCCASASGRAERGQTPI